MTLCDPIRQGTLRSFETGLHETLQTPLTLFNVQAVALQVYEVEFIQLSLGESKRPHQIAVYKSGPAGGFDQLEPWMYMVSEQWQCMTEFNVPVKLIPESVDDVICQTYPTPAADINEQV